MSRCVTLSDEAYNDLKTLKREEESFSMIVKRLTAEKKKEGLMALAGVWKDDTEMVGIMNKIIKDRKKFRL